jgi:superkiller protein 8
VKPVRAVAFTPLAKVLAAAGDSRVIALYDVRSGEQIALLSGHTAWITALHFSDTGEWLLSGLVSLATTKYADTHRAYDGKAKVWGMETRTCVATHGESDKAIWCAKWLPKTSRTEMFVLAGENRSISFYREASGG